MWCLILGVSKNSILACHVILSNECSLQVVPNHYHNVPLRKHGERHLQDMSWLWRACSLRCHTRSKWLECPNPGSFETVWESRSTGRWQGQEYRDYYERTKTFQQGKLYTLTTLMKLSISVALASYKVRATGYYIILYGWPWYYHLLTVWLSHTSPHCSANCRESCNSITNVTLEYVPWG